jgi:hypothetical protein
MDWNRFIKLRFERFIRILKVVVAIQVQYLTRFRRVRKPGRIFMKFDIGKFYTKVVKPFFFLPLTWEHVYDASRGLECEVVDWFWLNQDSVQWSSSWTVLRNFGSYTREFLGRLKKSLYQDTTQIRDNVRVIKLRRMGWYRLQRFWV